MESFEYFEDLAHNTVGEILADLCCDTLGIEELATLAESDEMFFSDLEDSHPHLWKIYDTIVDEIYTRLTDCELITENFTDEYPDEAEDLGERVDEDILTYLDTVRFMLS